MPDPAILEAARQFVACLLAGQFTCAWLLVSDGTRLLLAATLYVEHHAVLARAVGIGDHFFTPATVLQLLDNDSGGLRSDWLTAMAAYAQQCGWQRLLDQPLELTVQGDSIALSLAAVSGESGWPQLNVPLMLLRAGDEYRIDLELVLALRAAKAKKLYIAGKVAANNGRNEAAHALYAAAAALERIYPLMGHAPFKQHLATIGAKQQFAIEDYPYATKAAKLLAAGLAHLLLAA